MIIALVMIAMLVIGYVIGMFDCRRRVTKIISSPDFWSDIEETARAKEISQ
jgi:hypothetical protein